MKKIAFALLVTIFFIGSCSKKSVPSKTTAVDGSQLFSNNCARCHGATGTEGRAPNLAQTKLAKPELTNVITHGRNHMPAFEDKLTAKEIDAVTDFVASLKK
jgi:cytochrome c6